MDQALAALEELSSRVHDLFSDALKGPGVLSALRDFAAAVDWTVRLWGRRISHLVFLLLLLSLVVDLVDLLKNSKTPPSPLSLPPPLSSIPSLPFSKPQEPLVLSVLASHAALLALTVATRKSQTAQLAVLILCFALVRGGERLNALAAAKWDELFPSSASSSSSSSSSTAHPRRKRTNYFDDESGVFWSALVSAPLLLVMATQLASFSFFVFIFVVLFFRPLSPSHPPPSRFFFPAHPLQLF